jgi:fatty-acyl-CoA synthase
LVDRTISRVLIQAYQEVPEQVAVYLIHSHQADQPITYHRLLDRAAGYAQALRQAGIQPGEVVILLLNREEDLLDVFYGAILHGSIPSIMPYLTEKLSPEHYRQSLSALFQTTSPRAIITYPEFEHEVREATKNSISPISILLTRDIQPIERIDLDKLSGIHGEADQVALLQHSSGTTGLQKGVALSHRAIFNQLNSYSRSVHLDRTDVIVSWLPLYHDMGLIAGFLLPVLNRIPLVLMSPFEWVRAPYLLFQAISRYHGTLCWLPNFAYNFCTQKTRERDLTGLNLSSWRAVINCSEPMHWKSHQMFLDRFSPYGLRKESLATCYAMAENVFGVTQGGIDKPVTIDQVDQNRLQTEQIASPAREEASSVRHLSAGRPIDNTHLRIIDAQGNDLPERYIGEIVIQSDCMLSGYYNRPDLTQKAFLDGWYLTGDLGYLANGELFVTGRKKDLIIVGGKNIYPQDLERIASEIPGVHPGRVVAFGVFNEQLGTEEVVLLAEVDSGDNLERQHLADQLRLQVTRGSDIALRYVEIVDRGWLIKTSSGKIARSANRDKYLAITRDLDNV